MGTRVIVGVSGSLSSLAALHHAMDEARRTDALLVAVLAWTPPGGEAAYRRSPYPPLLKQEEKAATQQLDTAFEQAFGGYPDDVRIRSLTVRGEPGPVLVDVADRPDDVLVVSTGRRGNRLQRLLHGSVTRYCMAHARCVVTAVPPSELLAEFEHGLRLGDPIALLEKAQTSLG
ncbi:MAG: universal stress protein [Streptomycetaceae bacterium]|nr:universal stress protein [Streptomycetaceae bacterium]